VEACVTQCEAILAHLVRGETLTPLIAAQLYGTLALHSRVAELRERGNIIHCELVTLPNGKRVGSYRLESVAYG
jgi:hypothetical protein